MDTAQPPSAQPAVRKLFWIAFGLTVLIYLLMRWVSGGLSGAAIVAFEIAKTPPKAAAIIASWDLVAKGHFLNSIYADFLFILGYGSLFFFGCRYLGLLSNHYILRKAGFIFCWMAPVAGISDVLENTGMLYTIKRSLVPWVVHFTYDMAIIKFSLLFIMALFMVICLLFWGLGRLEARS